MIPANKRKDALLTGLYFLGSTVITWLFIRAWAVFYKDQSQMMLSCAIAGGKWAVQIIAALVFLSSRCWPFLRRIAFTCLIGSLILLPFSFPPLATGSGVLGILTALLISVIVMAVLYYKSVRDSGLPVSWFFGWLLCLAIAVTLQLTVVFGLM